MRQPTPLTPLRFEIVQKFRHKIKTGDFRAGIYLPSEQDLAKEFVASRWTIRNAIDYLVSQGDLVRTATGRLLIASPRPVLERESRRGTIHVWLRWQASSLSSRFLQGFAESLDAGQFSIRCGGIDASEYSDAPHEIDEANFLLEALASNSCTAVVVWRHPRSELAHLYREFLRRNLPLIFIETPPPAGTAAHFVGVDHVAGTAFLARKVVERGIQKFHVLSASPAIDSRANRTLAWLYQTLDALNVPLRNVAEHFIAPSTHLTESPPGGRDFNQTMRSFRSGMAHRDATASAVINLSPIGTAKIITALGGLGLDVPPNVEVFQAGTDLSLRCAPVFPGVYGDFHRVGRRAATHIQRLVRSTTQPALETILLHPDWNDPGPNKHGATGPERGDPLPIRRCRAGEVEA